MHTVNHLLSVLCWLQITALAPTAAAAAATLKPRQNSSAGPTATVRNGTYVGYYEPTYDTDYFLGMPYAQPPTGDLRFRVPRSLEAAWNGTRSATAYGPECIGYGMDTWSQGNDVSEDCLTLNVVRSRGAGDGLPVVVWIHGGGLIMGGSADHRYNQSFIVQQSAEAGMPIVAVSINYRLSSWGFLYGKEIQETGQTMNGFRDQRLALRWVQENIAAFGGDPARVTIQGESSGGTSVGAQLLAYNGRDDSLFAGAIAESGAPVSISPYPTVEEWEPIIANIASQTGCGNASDVLDCLRKVPSAELNSVINSTATSGASYGPVIDGDWFTQPAVQQLENGEFVKVPYIIGCNADEGTSFGPYQIQTTEGVLDYITGLGFDNATAQDIAILYPDIPAIGVPSTLKGRPDAAVGLEFKRTSAIVGDMRMNGPRRLTAHWWAKYDAPAYTYIFDVLVNGQWYGAGAGHFQEVAFVFYNTEGYGYPQNGNPNPLGGVERPEYLKLALQMVRMWISFVNFGDPNMDLGVEARRWPAYDVDQPKYYAFNQNTTSRAEPDLVRVPGVSYIEELIMARNGTDCGGIVACGASYDGDLDNM